MKKHGRDKNKFRLEQSAIDRIDAQYPDYVPADVADEYYPTDEDNFVGYANNRKKRHRGRKIIIRVVIICVIIMLINLGVLLWSGQLWFNEPKKRDYPMRGPLITNALGEVRWNNFSNQNLQFAYILATKGTGFTDKSFTDNWENSADVDMPTGAYHIFRYNIDGEKQAEYFCQQIGDDISGRLCPAVEVNIYGIYYVAPEEKEDVIENLTKFLDYVEDKYGVKPIIKCDSSAYKKYICDDSFDEYSIWYESIFSEPDEDIRWNFWEYSNRIRFSGYESSDKYLTMTVFNGSEDEFLEKYIIQ